MSDNSTPLAHAISALQNKNAPLAIQVCDSILANNPASADAHHIKALASKILGQFTQAEHSFYQSLHYQPNQPAAMSNLANLLMNIGKFDQAEIFFASSTKLAKHNMDAWLNWSIMLCKLGRYEQAIDKLNQALLINTKDHRILNLLGKAYQKIENFVDSIQAFNNALLLSPGDLQVLHNKGITYRIMNMPQKAIECYQHIQKSNHNYPELYFNIGCAFYDLNNKPRALENLKKAIALKPDYVEAHEALNKLYWEGADNSNFLISYQQRLEQVTTSGPLLYSYVAMLIMSKQEDKAQNVLETAIESMGRQHTFLHALAILKNKKSRNTEVISLLLEAHRQQPNRVRYLIDIANYYICTKEYSLALPFIEIAEQLAPLNQEIQAYKGISWRLMQDPKEKWLNDYDNFIQSELLDVPDGYQNLTHFMDELKEALLKMHGTERQPLDQSVVGGTQTVGRLLLEPINVIQDFKLVLEKRIKQYIRALPEDSTHPFLKRNTQKFKFSGSWSVRLKDGGFHVNHVHPEGWLSCCTYIDLPDTLAPNDPKKAGWVKFGETSLSLKERESIGKEICPQKGLCVLFPSYFWHGTNPFESSKYRMTIPCDIMPLI
jgi:tetratricopeptide (TPR) repeat protein